MRLKTLKALSQKMQKRLRKSAATRIVIEKIGKRFLDQVGFGRSLRTVWHQIDLERELTR